MGITSELAYYHISEAELGKNSKVQILTLGDSGEVFYELALEMVREIQKNNAAGKTTAFICPVGPVGQYPIFVRLVNEGRISLKNVWFFNMDEYLDADENWIDIDHPLSFRGFMSRNVYSKIDPELVMPECQRIFPDPHDPEREHSLLEKLGGADICFGGIGIDGHLAFNEPDDALSPAAFAALPTRIITILPWTLTSNSIGDLGGAIEAMPRKAVTIGMEDILAAKKIRIGVFRDWHRAVVRRAAYGEVTAAFPATLLQTHKDAMIIANHIAAQKAF